MSMKAIRKHLKKQETDPDPPGGEFNGLAAVVGCVGGVFVPMYFFGANYAESFFVGLVCAIVAVLLMTWLSDRFNVQAKTQAGKGNVENKDRNEGAGK